MCLEFQEFRYFVKLCKIAFFSIFKCVTLTIFKGTTIFYLFQKPKNKKPKLHLYPQTNKITHKYTIFIFLNDELNDYFDLLFKKFHFQIC